MIYLESAKEENQAPWCRISIIAIVDNVFGMMPTSVLVQSAVFLFSFSTFVFFAASKISDVWVMEKKQIV